MDREQAKEILRTWSPDRDPGEDRARMEEAFALLEQDPELAEWFAAENAMDDGLRAALQSVAPPEHLRASILAATQDGGEAAASEGGLLSQTGAGTTSAPTRGRRRFIAPASFLALAAAIALAIGIAAYLGLIGGGTEMDVATLDAAIPRMTSAHEHGFASATGDIEQVRAWMKEHGGAADFVVPGGLMNRGAVGCEVASVSKTQVSILCFHLGGGKTAHLYVVDRKKLSNPPPFNTPMMSQQGEYGIASWSQGDRSYFLASRGEAESLRPLLAPRPAGAGVKSPAGREAIVSAPPPAMEASTLLASGR